MTDSEILARIDHLEGSLRMEQHNFKEAETLLSRAAMLFSVAGETAERARALITLGYMYFLQGRGGALPRRTGRFPRTAERL